MLEIRGVVRARRQHGHGRALFPAGARPIEIGEQQVRIMLDRAYALRGEQFRKEPHHHLAVLQHVGDARRNPQIVLEDVELALTGADEVDAGDVRIDSARNLDSCISARYCAFFSTRSAGTTPALRIA
jgi:hypothetical protein